MKPLAQSGFFFGRPKESLIWSGSYIVDDEAQCKPVLETTSWKLLPAYGSWLQAIIRR